MTQSAKCKAAARLSQKRRRRRRAERVAAAKGTKAEEGRFLVKNAAEAEAAKSAKAVREPNPNVAQFARQDFEVTRRIQVATYGCVRTLITYLLSNHFAYDQQARPLAQLDFAPLRTRTQAARGGDGRHGRRGRRERARFRSDCAGALATHPSARTPYTRLLVAIQHPPRPHTVTGASGAQEGRDHHD